MLVHIASGSIKNVCIKILIGIYYYYYYCYYYYYIYYYYNYYTERLRLRTEFCFVVFNLKGYKELLGVCVCNV